jgi:hypothetical protein
MKRLDLLFKAARNEPPTLPSPGFHAQVLRALQGPPRSEPVSVFEQLDSWFPRIAFASALLIGACLLADNWSSGFGQTSLISDVAQLSDQWLFAVKGF